MPAKEDGKTFLYRVRSALAVTALAATAVTGAASPGQASPARADRTAAVTSAGSAAGECPFTDTLCLFDETGYGGERFAVTSLDPNGTCVSLVDHGWSGRARSALNTNGSSAAIFMNDDCLGGPFQVAGNSGVPDFGTFRPDSVWIP